MKNDLTCGVVRDLLPSYVEGLVGEESRQAVDRHLESCPDCTARKEAMSAPAEEAAEETAKEVDFLKKVKKRSAKRITLAVICTAVVLAGALALKIFVIGTPLQAQSVAVVVAEVHEDNTLYLSLISTGSGNAFYDWKMETVDGVTSIYARNVLVSLLCSNGQKELVVPLQNVQEVWLGGTSGRLVWQDGMVITQECLDLLELRTPYCGDAAALGRIADVLEIRNLGAYTTELQTAEEPYCWTLIFSERFSNPGQFIMARNEYLMLALVDNLGETAFTLPDVPNTYENQESTGWCTGGYLTRDQAVQGIQSLTEKYNSAHGTAWEAKESIKDYTQSPADFQRLIDILNWNYLKWEP